MMFLDRQLMRPMKLSSVRIGFQEVDDEARGNDRRHQQ